jgi:hypothetical protein
MASIGRSSAGPRSAERSSRRLICPAHGGRTIWPSRPLTSAVTRSGSVQHVVRLNRIWSGARSRRAARAPGPVVVKVPAVKRGHGAGDAGAGERGDHRRKASSQGTPKEVLNTPNRLHAMQPGFV